MPQVKLLCYIDTKLNRSVDHVSKDAGGRHEGKGIMKTSLRRQL